MLRTDLPEIITETLPGPKAQAIIDRREAVNPSAIKCIYPVVIEKDRWSRSFKYRFFTSRSCRSSQSTGRKIFPRNV